MGEELVKILITGSTGFLGKALLKTLLDKAEHEFVLLVRDEKKVQADSRVKVYKIIDGKLPDKLEEENLDVVLHMATHYGRENQSLSAIIEPNLILPINLLDFCLNKNIKYFFNIDTSLPKGLTPYSLSKKQFVDWLKKYNKNLTSVNVVLENFYGKCDGHFVSYVIEALLNDTAKIDLTSGNQRRDFIFYEDVVSAIMILLKNLENLPKGFNQFEVGAGKSISIREIVGLIKDITQNKKTLLNWGGRALRENEVDDACANISQMAELGWRPSYTLRDGLEKVIVQYKNDQA